MTTRSSGAGRRTRDRDATPTGAAGATNGNGPAPWDLFADLGRQQLAVSTEAASVLFRGSEAIRTVQRQAAHDASLRHQAALQKLQASTDPGDLVAVQSELIRFDFEQASLYWQKLTQATLQTQVEMLGCAGHLFEGAAGSSMRSALMAFQTTLPQAGSRSTGQTD